MGVVGPFPVGRQGDPHVGAPPESAVVDVTALFAQREGNAYIKPVAISVSSLLHPNSGPIEDDAAFAYDEGGDDGSGKISCTNRPTTEGAPDVSLTMKPVPVICIDVPL